MASSVEICNRALQKVGAKRITSLTEDSVNARACNTAYDPIRMAELRAHPWSFAITRAELAADSAAPIFGRAYSYTLPADFLKLVEPYPEDITNNLDWIIEGKKIYTNDTAPIYIRYVYNVEDAAEMDALFREALAARLAVELCESLTQSNTKKEALLKEYILNIREARRCNGIEKRSAVPPTDPWITARI